MQRYLRESPLKSWLKQHSISQQQAAEALDISVSSLNRKLNLRTAWLDDDLTKIGAIFGVSSDFVLGIKMPRRESSARGEAMDHQQDCREIRLDSTSRALSPVVADGGVR